MLKTQIWIRKKIYRIIFKIEGRFESSSDEGSEPEAKGQPNCNPHSEQTTDTAEPNTASPELNLNISQTSQNISQDNQEAPKVVFKLIERTKFQKSF